MENKEKFVSTNDLEDGVTGGCTIRRRPSVGRKAITKPFKVATLDSCQSAKAGHEREREPDQVSVRSSAWGINRLGYK